MDLSYSSEDYHPLEDACKAIGYLMAPFRPGDILFFVEPTVAGQVVTVLITSLPNDPFVLTDLNIIRFAVSSPDFFYQELGIRAGKFFNSLPKPPIGDNVVLSEN